MDLTMMEGVGDRWEKMEGSCSTGQSPQWAVVPVEEEEEEEQQQQQQQQEEEEQEYIVFRKVNDMLCITPENDISVWPNN
jgi:hypothetical protein